DRLRTVARIDATGAEKHQSLHPCEVSTVHQVGLDHQVLIKKVGAIDVVCLDSADLGRGNKDVVGTLFAQESMDCGLVQQIQLRALAGQDSAVALSLQPPHERAADHAAMSCNE